MILLPIRDHNYDCIIIPGGFSYGDYLRAGAVARFSNIMHHLLKPNGIAVFELSHFFKKDDILNIFNNFSNVEFFNDLNNDCRAIKIVNT